jgi:hypothetical protein
MESDRVVSANDRNLAILISVTALGSIGIYFATRNSGFFSTSVVPVDSAAAADSTLHGADWNGALPIAIASDRAPLPSASDSRFGSAFSPPTSVIPAPMVPLPIDESASESRRFKASDASVSAH